MNIAQDVAGLLAEHTTLELECIDRMYLNLYVPLLQSGAGTSYFFRKIRGNPAPSSALMAPMTRRFVDALERYARERHIDLIRFGRGERKDERTQAYLRQWHGGEGALYIGKAQERARVLRTERRHHPASGASYPWLTSSTAMVNHYYVYLVDEDFGPLFVTFCSYFPYNAKLCLNVTVRSCRYFGPEVAAARRSVRPVPDRACGSASVRANRVAMRFQCPTPFLMLAITPLRSASIAIWQALRTAPYRHDRTVTSERARIRQAAVGQARHRLRGAG